MDESKQYVLLKDTIWHKKGTRFVQYSTWTNMYRVRNGGKRIEIVHYPADLPKSHMKLEGRENDKYKSAQTKQTKEDTNNE